MIQIGESKKRIYTIPEGEYAGVWSGYNCQIFKNGFTPFGNIETATGMKGIVKCKVVVIGVNAKIYKHGT